MSTSGGHQEILKSALLRLTNMIVVMNIAELQDELMEGIVEGSRIL